MSVLSETVATEVAVHYVTPTWVARHFGVSRLQVYRAIAAKRLIAVPVANGPRRAWVLDKRLLPDTFPA